MSVSFRARARCHRRLSTCCISGSWSRAAAEAALLVAAAAELPRREVGEVVEELVDEAVLDPEAADLGRTDDRLAALLAAHARGEGRGRD